MKFIVDSLDNVEETDKQFFEPTDDGKFQWNRAKFEETAKAGLLKKNRELLGKLKDLDKLGRFKDVDDDTWSAFEEWRQSQGDESNDDGDKKQTPAPPDLKKLLKQETTKLGEAHKAQLAEKEKALSELQSRFDRYVLDQQLTALALEAGVIPERLESYKRTVGDRFALKDGKLVALEDGEESDAPAEKIISETLRKQYDWFYAAREQGGGSGQQKGGKSGPKTLQRSKMTPKEKSDFIKEHGNAKFLKLPL